MKKKMNFWKTKKFIVLSFLIIAGAFVYGASIVRADPVVYYFNNAVNQSPAELGNYWYDDIMTDPALELPNFAVDYVNVVGAVFDGDAVFRGNSGNFGEVTGNAVFYDGTVNDGQVDGNAEFFGTATNGGQNGGIVIGNATFHDDSQSTRGGGIQGSAFFYDNASNGGSNIAMDATFYGDSSVNNGDKNGASTVQGTQFRYYTVATVTIRDFTAVGPWTVVADGVEVDVTGATFDVSTTFSAINGGSFIGADAPNTYYFNNAVNTDPTELGNYWTDSDCTVQAGGTPNFAIDEVFIGGCNEIVFYQVIFAGDATLNVNATNKGTITGNAVFNDSSSNVYSGLFDSGQGIVQGNAVFNDASLNNSVVEGDAEFYDTAENFSDGFVGGEIQGNAVFHDSSRNRGTLAANGTFNNSSRNEGSINGDATFNDNSELAGGTVTGDATFNEDIADIPGHGGTVSGTKTRRYITNVVTPRNFTTNSPWTVLADGAEVNLTDATFNGTTTFTTLNGGSFVFPTPVLSLATVKAKKITLTYNRTLDTGSVPAVSDYSVLVNGISVSVSTVSVTGSTVVLTLNLSENASINDVITFDYTPGTNPVRMAPNAEAAALNDRATTITSSITIGGGTTGDMITVGNTVYVATSSSVAIVDALTLSTTGFINVVNSPADLTLSGTKLYVLNRGSNRVSVINTLTNTVSSTIIVGSSPFGAVLVGNKLYVANAGSSSVSVINTLTDTVVATIGVGSGARNPVLVGTKLYVPNYSGSSVSVIDTLTDTVSSTISVGSTPQSIARIGSKLYVVNVSAATIKVIDIATDTVISTITSTGSNLRSITVFKNKLYVTDSANGQVVIVDSTTDTITGTIPTGAFANPSALIDGLLLVGNFNGGTVTIINPITDSVITSIVSANTNDFTNIGSTVYISNQSSAAMTISNLKALVSQLPNLVSFSSSSSNGTYSAGQTIAITAHFARALQAGSTMTVSLNTGASVVLDSVSAGTLSGTYTVAGGESTPDLSVTAITSASISDLEAHSRTSYSLNSSIAASDAENISIVRNIGDVKNITVGSYATMTTGQQPQYISPAITVAGVEYLYVSNKTDNTVSVIRKSDGFTQATLTVGSGPTGITAAYIAGAPKVYVANSGSNTVSVIDAITNTVSSTVSVGTRPSHLKLADSKLYVSNNGSNSLSVINTGTNTVTTTIAVGLAPRGLETLGTKLYVANYGDQNVVGGNFISVINTLTDTVSDTILQPVGSAGNYGIAIYNNNLYLTNYINNTVSVIDADSKALEATISVSGGPRDIILANNTLYVSALDGGTIWSINPSTNLETAIIVAGHSPMGMSSSGNFLYYARYQDNLISLINLSNNSLSNVLNESLSTGGGGSVSSTTPQTPSTPLDPATPEIPNPGTETEVETETPASQKIDPALTERLKGRLLLAVEDRGKIWYLDPVSGKRYHVRLDNALTIFRRFALGITDANLAQVPVAPSTSRITALANRLKGRILLQVEKMGFTWYVDTSGKRHLITVFTVLDVFKKLSLGITNENLNKIEIGVFK